MPRHGPNPYSRLCSARAGVWLRDSGAAWSVGVGPGGWRESADGRGEVRADFLSSAYANGPIGSTVVCELALRPGFSPHARIPPTARPAPRGGRRGLLVLTAGRCCSTGVTPPARWPRPNLVERAGVLALFLARILNRGMERREDDDADRTGSGGASARRIGSRSQVAAGFLGDRCPATLERSASAQYSDHGRSGRSARSPLRVSGANVRLAEPRLAGARWTGIASRARRRRRLRELRLRERHGRRFPGR